jgi:hypothetical protein
VKVGIWQYASLKRDCNPWLPAQPGDHGFVFVGLTDDASIGDHPEVFEVFEFVGVAQWRYLGQYRWQRVEPLTREHWLSLNPSVSTALRDCRPPPAEKNYANF